MQNDGIIGDDQDVKWTIKAVLLVLLCILTMTALAQDAEKTFKNSVMKQQRYLRGFSADPVVRWRWDGSALVMEEPKLRTLGVFITESVKVKSDRIELRGARSTLLLDKKNKPGLSYATGNVLIVVELNGASIGDLLPTLDSSLFYASAQEAHQALPKQYRKALPAHTEIKSGMDFVKDSCDCSDIGTTSCVDVDLQMKIKGMKPPKILHTVEPEFSDEARMRKFNGFVQIGFDVGVDGKTSNLWIVRPAAFGLDQKAATAVSQYVFAPATCHGQPVATNIYVDVNFQIY